MRATAGVKEFAGKALGHMHRYGHAFFMYYLFMCLPISSCGRVTVINGHPKLSYNLNRDDSHASGWERKIMQSNVCVCVYVCVCVGGGAQLSVRPDAGPVRESH